ncbi:MAG: helix-hairpin-helix domain-containing protein [Clostridium sp.]
MMDGGRGQVNIAEEVLAGAGTFYPGLRHGQRMTITGPGGCTIRTWRSRLTGILKGFRLITRIQDEAHRFAIEIPSEACAARSQVRSVLDDIPGIGDTRRRALMKHFKSIEAVQAASEEELAAGPPA